MYAALQWFYANYINTVLFKASHLGAQEHPPQNNVKHLVEVSEHYLSYPKLEYVLGESQNEIQHPERPKALSEDCLYLSFIFHQSSSIPLQGWH